MEGSKLAGLSALCLVFLSCAPPPPPATESSPEPMLQLTRLEGHESQITFSPDGEWIAFEHRLGDRSAIQVAPADGKAGPRALLADNGVRQTSPAFSPDGRSIAFVSGQGDSSAVWTVPAAGGEARRLSGPGRAASRPWWSPDGQRLAFNVFDESTVQVWLADVESGENRQLTRGAGKKYLYGFSPDGGRVVIAWWEDSDVDLWSVDVETGELIELLDHEGEEYWPHWSPDGGSVVFYTTWGERMTDVWKLDLATGEPSAVTTHPGEDYRPRFSPDGKWIAFFSDRESKSGLWMAPARGGEPIALVTSGRVRAPLAWAPDSRSIVFSLLATRSILYRQPLAGGEAVALTDGAFNVFNPAVAGDGRVAFDSDRFNSERDLLLQSASGGEPAVLTREVANNGYPSWSPEDRRIAYKGNQGGGWRTSDIWTLDPADPSDRRQITRHGYIQHPVWCGDNIVFRYLDDRLGVRATEQIWTVPAGGGESRQLTSTPDEKIPTDCSRDGRRILFTSLGGEGEKMGLLSLDEQGRVADEVRLGAGEGARFSPDETRVAFVSTRDGECDVYVMSVSGEDVERLTRTGACESWPDWTSDEALIYSVNPGDQDLWRIDVEHALAHKRKPTGADPEPGA